LDWGFLDKVIGKKVGLFHLPRGRVTLSLLYFPQIHAQPTRRCMYKQSRLIIVAWLKNWLHLWPTSMCQCKEKKIGKSLLMYYQRVSAACLDELVIKEQTDKQTNRHLVFPFILSDDECVMEIGFVVKCD
jgi:hypothetical protein